MNAIEAMAAEIKYQVEDLPRQELPLPSKNCLFIGSGDSYIAGLVAQHMSGGRTLCFYPTDFIQDPSIAYGRSVYVVSISGNTKANILAARIAKRKAACTTAITARPASLLARTCDQIIRLKYRSSGTTTAGTISFTASTITCISLVARLRLPDFSKLYQDAEKQAERVSAEVGGGGCYFILGDGILHPITIYGSLKFQEVFGARSLPYQTEEFCHSPLFSIKKGDQFITLGLNSKQLYQRLVREGFSSVHVSFGSKGIELLLKSTFFMQLLVLKMAQRRKMTSCFFLKNKRLLRMSSDLIYW